MATWNIDPMHSEIGFKVKHLVISSISGKFKQFEGAVEAGNDDFSDAKISFNADIESVDTGVAQRDEHLKGEDFFDTGNHPKLSFESTSIEKDGNDFKVAGNLTIKNITKAITFHAEFGGVGPDMYGRTVAGFELDGKINRKDFGLTWNGVTETGGIVVGDDVKLIANVELVKQA